MRFIIIILLLVASVAGAQDLRVFPPDSVEKRVIDAVEITRNLKIDGVLDEPEWSMAKPSPHFTQVTPVQGGPANFNTSIKVLYNDNFLYVGIICSDSLGKKALRATDLRRDFDHMEHDLVNLGFDCFNDKRNAMTFVVNPYGAQRDYLAFDAMYYDIDWDGLWRTNATRNDSSWISEVAIPWKTLRYPKTDDSIQNWGFQVYRNRRMTNEISGFSPFPLTYSASRMDYAGKLNNLKPPPPKTNISIQPYALASYDGYDGSDPSRPKEENSLKAGGELKWVINPNNVLDLTYNTDFAQADVDRKVNNTTRFNVFYPERRQFFLENASLFGINVNLGYVRSAGRTGGPMQMQPFFSRRIGLNDNGEPIPIVAGGRFVHRSDKHNYGAILIRQQGDSITSHTNFFVGRFSENLGKQNRIGGLLTVKNQPEGSNITGTTDMFFRFNGVHSLISMVSYSGSTNSGKQGVSGVAQYNYATNNWKLWWTESVVTRDFNPEMGFVSRSNVIGTTPGIIYYYRGDKLPLKKWIRSFDPGIDAQIFHEASTGKLIERQLIFYPIYFDFHNAGYLGYGLNDIFQHLPETFSPLGVPIEAGDYKYVQHTIVASSDPADKFKIFGSVNWGDYFDGRLTTGDINAFYAPIPHISLGGQFNRNTFNDVGMENISKTVDLYSIEARLALNARIQLSSFIQKNSENDLYNLNARFSWEYQPLSFIYIVFNRNQYNNALQQRQREDQLITKVSFLKQF
ncbi:MAG: carbohydrate binding family 9 domain-containing protein [Bacteroidales bacterium]|jgi:hypothetical protein|nr:carbohydrate binding family 9 domain-containing protein [Bacteroidales bacterium]